MEEIYESDVLLFYTEKEDKMRVALVEFGAALMVGINIFWVGEDQPSATKHKCVTICKTLDEAVIKIKAITK